MFEHMAFKGTDKIGTTNVAAEKPLLDETEVAYKAWDKERRKDTGKDPKKEAELKTAVRRSGGEGPEVRPSE